MSDPKQSTRYPYTYACDYIRQRVGSQFTRADASLLLSDIASSMGMTSHQGIAEALADHFIREGNA